MADPRLRRDDWAPEFQRDAYGGSPIRTFGATGYFCLERDDRWWFVTPDGNAFLSWGTNHIEPRLFVWPNNRRYWGVRFATEPSLENPAFLGAIEKRIALDMAAWNMNTLGCHSPTEWYRTLRLPYVHTVRFVDISHWQHPTETDFWDPFDDAFARRCDALARAEGAPRAEDTYLLGYTLTDCPILTPLDAAERVTLVYGRQREATPTWPGVLRNLPPSSPGKHVWVELAREQYSEDIAAFNATYGTAFVSFDDLLRAVDWSRTTDASFLPGKDDRRAADYFRFLERIVERYYDVARSAIRRHDPNHLFFGDKLNGNTGVPDGIMRIVGRYADLVFFQWYGWWEEQSETLDHWAGLTGKPLFNGDSSFSVPECTQKAPLGPHCGTEEERVTAFWCYARNAFAREDFVGWNWCGYMDKTDGYGQDARHSGLQDPFGHHDRPTQLAMADLSAKMYALATAKAR